MQRLINILFALDCALFSVCTLVAAYPFESFSSACYRSRMRGGLYGKLMPLIDAIASLFGQKEHCKSAYFTARLNLPPDQL